jgi:hypothetical protein
MGCGFCVVVPESQADAAVVLLGRHLTGAAVIGATTDQAGLIELPQAGLAGRKDEGFRPA